MIAGVPYDAEVEYLESTGRQWIDTGVSLAGVRNWLGACEITRLLNTNSTEQPIFSTWVGAYDEFNTFIRLTTNDTTGDLDQYAAGHLTISGFARNQKKMIQSGVDLDGIYGLGPNVRFITLDTVTKTAPLKGEKSNPTTLKLFTRGDLSGRSSLRMYSFSLLIGTEYAINCFPVRVGTVGYLYDRVTRKLFGNQGTGAFTIGPDVAEPVMGLHFYPDGEESEP